MTISKSDSMIQVLSNLKPLFCKPDQLYKNIIFPHKNSIGFIKTAITACKKDLR